MPSHDPSPDGSDLDGPAGGIEVTLGIDQLEAFLDADDPDVRAYAARTLADEARTRPADVRSAVDALTDRLEDEPAIRAHATAALAAVSRSDPAALTAAVPALTDRLDGAATVRADAVDALAAVAESEPTAVVESILELAETLEDDDDTIVRRASAALDALTAQAPEDVATVGRAITNAAGHDDEVVRGHAVHALAAIASAHPEALSSTDSVVPRLVDRLEDTPSIRGDAIAALRRLVEHDPARPALEIEPIADRLADPAEAVRIDAGATLAAVSAADPARVQPAIEPLIDALEDVPAVRGPAAESLRHVAGDDPDRDALAGGVDAITGRLEDVRATVRQDAAATLEAIATERPEAVGPAVSALADRLEDADPETREHAVTAIESVATARPSAVAPVVPALADCLDADRLSVRVESASAIAAVASDHPERVRAVVPALTPCLETGDDGVRRPAASAIRAVAVDGTDDVDSIERHLAVLDGLGDEDGTDDPGYDGWQRGHAARSLAEVAEGQLAGIHPAVRSLRNRLADEDVTTRRAAARDLIDVASDDPRAAKSSIDAIADCLEDDDASVRNNAAIALGQLAMAYPDDVRGAVDRLFRSVDDPDRTVRTNVIHTLERIGPSGARRPAFDLAVAETGAADPTIRASALEALAMLRPETGTETTDAIEAVLDRLGDPACSALERVRALDTLERLLSAGIDTEPTPTALVVENLGGDDLPLVRALADVARVEPTAVDPVKKGLLEGLETAATVERGAYCRTLTRIADPEGPPVAATVVERFGDERTGGETLVRQVLRDPVDGRRARETIAGFLEHDAESVRGYATLALAALVVVGEADRSVLGDHLERIDDRLLDAASIVAGGETPTHTDAVNKQLSGLGRRVDGDPWAGGLATLALFELTDVIDELRPTAIDKLARGLAVESPVVRSTAAAVLAELAADDPNGFENALPALVDALDDEDDDVRTTAARTLRTLATEPGPDETDVMSAAGDDLRRTVTNRLIDRLADPDSRVRVQACHGLRRLATTTPPALEALTDDPVPSVAEAATDAREHLAQGDVESTAIPGAWLDWQMARGGATRTSSVPSGESLSPAVDCQWQQTTEGATTAPTIVADTLYVGSDDGYVSALALEGGDERWRYRTGGAVTTPPAVLEERVYAPCADGLVYALDRETGERVWHVEVGAAVETPAIVAAGVVYLGAEGTGLHALDAEDGSTRWRATLDGCGPITDLAVGERVYVSTADGHVLAISTDGTLEWERVLEPTPAGHTPIVGIAATPGDGVVLAACRDGTVVALEDATGTTIWRFATGGTLENAPAVAHGTAYVASTDLSVYAVDIATGGERFRFDTGGATPSGPVVIDDVCCVGTDDGVIYALDGADGAATWRYDSEDGVPIEALSVASGLLCAIGGENSRLLVLGDERASWADRIGFSGLLPGFSTRN